MTQTPGNALSTSYYETGSAPWRYFRRVIMLALMAFGMVLFQSASPFLVLFHFVNDPLWRNRRLMMRLHWYMQTFLYLELAGYASAFAIWFVEVLHLATTAQARAWDRQLFMGYIVMVCRSLETIYGMRLHYEADDLTHDGPFIVFARHVSTFDTMLPGRFLYGIHGIQFRHVIKQGLLWFPMLNLLGPRTPNHFVRRGDTAREIAGLQELVKDLGPREAVAIFPEGTRYTAEKARAAIARLETEGHPARVASARRLKHLLPMRLGGPMGLLAANPAADVLFLAHRGFERTHQVYHLLNGSLIHARFDVRVWRVRASEIPSDPAEREAWLLSWWERVDAWLDELESGVRSLESGAHSEN